MSDKSPSTIIKINKLNQDFYQKVAPFFSETRDYAWEGWDKLAKFTSQNNYPVKSVLDLACGNARFAKFAKANFEYTLYIGIDSDKQLLDFATKEQKDIQLINDDVLNLSVETLAKLNQYKFDLVTAFGLMHHLPNYATRLNFLNSIKTLVGDNGLIAISFWNFLSSTRISKKIVSPSLAAFQESELGENDYILSWNKGTTAYRFCHNFTETEISRLVSESGLREVFAFKADGPNSISNDYRIFALK